LLDVPKGLKIYIIPKEAKRLNADLNFMTNSVLFNLLQSEEIIFEDGSIEKIPDNYFTFGASPSLKRIKLPNGIKYLGNNCIDVTKVKCNFPNTLEHLGKNMYPEVKNLFIGDNITSLGDAFASHDTNLEFVEVSGSVKELPKLFINQCKNIKRLVLKEGVEKAGVDAFKNLNSLEYVELPESFKGPFSTSMEKRPGSNKRGNSKYDIENFEKQKNSILTIKKIYNGIPYIFQVRRGDFSQILFSNMTATIKSCNPQYKDIIIDLSKLDKNSICQVNISMGTIQASSQQSNVYLDEEIRKLIDEIFKEYVWKTDLFHNLDLNNKTKVNLLFARVLYKNIDKIKVGNVFNWSLIEYLFKEQIKSLNEGSREIENTEPENNGGKKI